MPELHKWIELYRSSANPDIRIRVARNLVQRSDVPLWLLLDILDNLSHEGLGAAVQMALMARRDSELLVEMTDRLNADDEFVRQVACSVLGRTENPVATQHLLRMLDDPHIMVRRAAGFGLAYLKDNGAIPELKRQALAKRNDDANVVRAQQFALQSLGVDADPDR